MTEGAAGVSGTLSLQERDLAAREPIIRSTLLHEPIDLRGTAPVFFANQASALDKNVPIELELLVLTP